MKYTETLLLWNERPPRIALHRIVDRDVIRPMDFSHSGGAAYVAVSKMQGAELVARVLLDAWDLAHVYEFSVYDVHRAFYHIDEYVATVGRDRKPSGYRKLRDNMVVLVLPGRALYYHTFARNELLKVIDG